MVLNTVTAAVAITPTVIETFFSHYLNRGPLHQKPTAHLSYHTGLQLIRRFLDFASKQTVDDVQAFTSQAVPNPHWVRVENIVIPESHLGLAVELLTVQLGPEGIEAVGGGLWWQWRLDEAPLRAEWIEMRRDYNARKNSGATCRRSMLYVHGGAYYFGSVDEHRYQIQRHARKLQARVLAPRYRLAPQFPFPCGLLDCLAAYLYLLTVQAPETIILAGDSAGGGMVVSLLIILRDRGLPLPAGAVLISPWVDLTHSFPSVAGFADFDYVPSHGFVHRPSITWPPPNSDDLEALQKQSYGSLHKLRIGGSTRAKAAEGFEVHHLDGADGSLKPLPVDNPAQDPTGKIKQGNLSIKIDDQLVEIKDQVQIYTTNHLISHPLVSPVLQPSLGGLPPLLVLVGGGELLRDEQIYLAHKAAAPSQYPSRLSTLPSCEADMQWPPTNVQLQVWDDLCHVAPTLSFTRPAKHMYRSCAQFAAWALARDQKNEITIPEDVESSESDDDSSTSSQEEKARQRPKHNKPGGHDDASASTLPGPASGVAGFEARNVGKAGCPLPPFTNHMIRQRVDRHGLIFPLEPASELAGCSMAVEQIGVLKAGPVTKWMEIQKEWAVKFSKQKRTIQQQRLKEMENADYGRYGDDIPPPTALVGRRGVERLAIQEQMMKRRQSKGLAMWANWGSKRDEEILNKEEERSTENSKSEQAVESDVSSSFGVHRESVT